MFYSLLCLWGWHDLMPKVHVMLLASHYSGTYWSTYICMLVWQHSQHQSGAFYLHSCNFNKISTVLLLSIGSFRPYLGIDIFISPYSLSHMLMYNNASAATTSLSCVLLSIVNMKDEVAGNFFLSQHYETSLLPKPWKAQFLWSSPSCQHLEICYIINIVVHSRTYHYWYPLKWLNA